MIIGLVKLPDRSHIEVYANIINTSFGQAGRNVLTSSALSFYKMIVTHGVYILEYVMATTQDFNSSFSVIKERVSGLTYTDPRVIHLCPISVKLIGPDYCDNFLFVESISYLLMFGGPPVDEFGRCTVTEFSNPPTYLSNTGPCSMSAEDLSGAITIQTLLSKLTDNLENAPKEIPDYVYSLNLNHVSSLLTDNVSNKIDIDRLLAVNDIGFFSWIFESLEMSKKQIQNGWYPVLPDTHGAVNTDRFDMIHKMLLAEPVLGACIKTPSVINLWSLRPYFANVSSFQMYEALAANYNTNFPFNDIKILDTNWPEFKTFDIRALVEATMYSNNTDVDIIVENGIAKSNVSCNWFGSVSSSCHSNISSALVNIRNIIAQHTRTSNIVIKFNKNWLDEIWLSVAIDGSETWYYIPIWYYNLSSPCAINDTLLSSVQSVFNKI